MFYGTVAAALGSGLIAGTFFVFSVAVMPAFRRLPSEIGKTAMKRINEVIQNPLFLGVFLGTAVICVVLPGLAILAGVHTKAFVLAGSLLYLVGSFLVTVVFNVPLNNALAASNDPDIWQTYLSRWSAWNHVRTVASTMALASYIVAVSEMR